MSFHELYGKFMGEQFQKFRIVLDDLRTVGILKIVYIVHSSSEFLMSFLIENLYDFIIPNFIVDC